MLTIVGLHADNDLSTTVGWGECSALNHPGYTPEWAEGCFELLREGQPVDVSKSPLAHAAFEMAFLDAELKGCGVSLSEHLGTSGARSTAGAVVGLGPVPWILAEVEDLVSDGYRRVKLKVTPDHLLTPVSTVRSAFPEIELQVDANGSLGADDLDELSRLADLGVTVVEQPFSSNDTALAARLEALGDTCVVADESVRGIDDLADLAISGAASGVAVKPPKLGGVEKTLQILAEVERLGLRGSVGGMLESGLGRHLLAAIAPKPVFDLVGDLSPASRWLIDDPFPDLDMNDGEIPAPTRPGIAGEPDLDMLDHFTVRSALVAPLPTLLR